MPNLYLGCLKEVGGIVSAKGHDGDHCNETHCHFTVVITTTTREKEEWGIITVVVTVSAFE
jgi:hypothetical protein